MVERTSGPEKFHQSVEKDFFNTTCQKQTGPGFPPTSNMAITG
jgi:hypothetical protein